MNLLNLPTEICRIIYHRWYFPYVLKELIERVPQDDGYFVSRISEENQVSDITVIYFSLKSGKMMHMFCQTQTILRLNRKDTLVQMVGRRY